MQKKKNLAKLPKTTYGLLEGEFSFWLWELGHSVQEEEPSSFGLLFSFCLGSTCSCKERKRKERKKRRK